MWVRCQHSAVACFYEKSKFLHDKDDNNADGAKAIAIPHFFFFENSRANDDAFLKILFNLAFIKKKKPKILKIQESNLLNANTEIVH